jgi:hypothetical protein
MAIADVAVAREELARPSTPELSEPFDARRAAVLSGCDGSCGTVCATENVGSAIRLKRTRIFIHRVVGG